MTKEGKRTDVWRKLGKESEDKRTDTSRKRGKDREERVKKNRCLQNMRQRK